MTSFLSGTLRGRVLRMAVVMGVMGAALFGTLFSHASSTEINYSGHYELTDVKAGLLRSAKPVVTPCTKRPTFTLIAVFPSPKTS